MDSEKDTFRLDIEHLRHLLTLCRAYNAFLDTFRPAFNASGLWGQVDGEAVETWDWPGLEKSVPEIRKLDTALRELGYTTLQRSAACNPTLFATRLSVLPTPATQYKRDFG